jgi:hypothetical protein
MSRGHSLGRGRTKSHPGIVVFRPESQDKPTLVALLNRLVPVLPSAPSCPRGGAGLAAVLQPVTLAADVDGR